MTLPVARCVPIGGDHVRPSRDVNATALCVDGMAAPRVHHLAVTVRDLARAEAFYAGVLGLVVVRRWADESGAPRSIWLTLGGEAFLAVERADDGAPARPAGDPPGWHCVALAIEPRERETWRARLARGGFPVERESAFTLYARDSEGNLVALSHYPDPV